MLKQELKVVNAAGFEVSSDEVMWEEHIGGEK